ncbi:MAG: Ig-like domain-containing protein, partial [Acidobacteria bacterium]|nr:Ig-like domain-containing protein [Acidobacteriota bacterium]
GGGPYADPAVGVVPLAALVSTDTAVLTFSAEGYYQVDGLWQETGGGTIFQFTTPSLMTPSQVSSVDPADGAAGVPVNTSVSVTFNKAMTASTVTTNTADTACSGSVQVSADSFSSCVQMSAAPATTDNTTFTITPVSSLANSTTYKVRVTTAVTDPDGIALAADFTQPNGFTTSAPEWTLTLNAVNGQIFASPPPNGQDPSKYTDGTPVTLSASADFGYHFVNWTGDCSGSDPNNCSVTMTQDRTVTANFAHDQSTLSYDGNGNTGGSAPSSITGDIGSTTPVAGPGSLVKTHYVFTGWCESGFLACYNPGDPFTFQSSNTTLFAQWQGETLNLDVESDPGSGGSTSPNGTVQVHYGDVQYISATPNAGYHFVNWSQTSGSANIDNPNSDTTFVSLTTDSTVTANFAADATVSVYHDSQVEGNSGTKTFHILVYRQPQGSPVTSTVDWNTVDGTATVADNDYVAASGTVTFQPFEDTKYIDVTVNGDTTQEPDETFSIHLSNPTNASIGVNDDASKILNDDNTTNFVVTKTADTNDHVCDSDCTLREAIEAANASEDLNRITFNIPTSDPGYSNGVWTIVLNTGLGIDTANPYGNSVYIDGPGADKLIIHGNIPTNRMFRFSGLGNYRMSGMTIENGYLSNDQGGAVYAISSDLFTLDHVWIRNSGSGDDGGAISFWQGNFEIKNSTVAFNQAANNCGGMKLSNGNLSITNSTFSNNTASAGYGGGACFYGDSNVTIRKSTFAFNGSVGDGGGIYNYNGSVMSIGDS